MIPPNLPPPGAPAAVPDPTRSLTSEDSPAAASFADILAQLALAGRDFLGRDTDTLGKPIRVERQRAEIFNEQGLMGEAVATILSAPPAPPAAAPALSAELPTESDSAPAPSSPPRSGPSPVAQLRASLYEGQVDEVDPATGRRASPAVSAAVQAEAGVAPVAPPARRAGALPANPAIVETLRVAAGEFESSLGRIEEASEVTAPDVPTTDVQLSLQAGPDGMEVLVRADRLNREQRERLREEIARILAAYGHESAQIRMNGETGASRNGREAG